MNPDLPPPQPESEAVTREQFKKAPLVRRRFAVRLDISRELFAERTVSAMEAIQSAGEFQPVFMKPRWDFRIEHEGTMPRPKGRLIHYPVLIRAGGPAEPRTTIECFPPMDGTLAQFSIEQELTELSESRFEDLESECQRWVPILLEHFQLRQTGGLLLQYRNEITRARFPDFWEGEDTLRLGDLLWIFQNEGGPEDFVTPFLVQFHSSTGLDNNSKVRFRAGTEDRDPCGFLMFATFAYSSLGRRKGQPVAELWPELTHAHDLLFRDFVRQFTSTALEAFRG